MTDMLGKEDGMPGANEFLPEGFVREEHANGPYKGPVVIVGTSGKTTVFCAEELGAEGQALGVELLGLVDDAYHLMEGYFGILGSPVQVVIAPLKDNAHDGSGGGVHASGNFSSVIYIDATFALPNAANVALGLYILELSECFMTAQKKGWDAGASNGEGLSRFCARVTPYASLPSGFATGPSWVAAGYPDWVSFTDPNDLHYASTGCAVLYLYWMLSLGHSIVEIISAGGATLAGNYKAITGKVTAYDDLKAAVQAVQVTSDNPFTGRLGLNVYGDVNGMRTVRQTPDIGQGAAAVGWLAGDFTGSGKAEIAQMWNNNGYLGLIVYGDVDGSMTTIRRSPNTGQGPWAITWLAGDFTGSGKTEIAQAYDNDGHLGLIIYGDAYDTMQGICHTADTGQGSPAVGWLAGDFTRSGKAEIAQMWNNNGHLGLIIYGHVNGTMQVIRRSPNTGHGPWAIAWLAGDFTGSGKAEIAQMWNNNGHLGLIIYGDAYDTMQGICRTPDTGQGSPAVGWLAGDFTGSGKAEIAQMWNNDGHLGLIIYGYVDGTMQVIRRSPDTGEGAAAVGWLAGDFTGSGKAEIAQMWNNDGYLGLIVYGDVDGTMTAIRRTPNTRQGAAAVGWLAGDFTRSGKAEIAQPWSD
jgi:cell division inhibitor SulA